MSSSASHPIAKLAFELIETDSTGRVALTDADALRLGDALLAYGDDDLLEAVRQLAIVGGMVMNHLAMLDAKSTGDRILRVAELAKCRLMRLGRRKAAESERARASMAKRIGAVEPLKKKVAPTLGSSRPASARSVASMMPRRLLR